MLRRMGNQHHKTLLAEIEQFLAETGMGASYLGSRAVGNSSVVQRLRQGRRIYGETEKGLRQFIEVRKAARCQ